MDRRLPELDILRGLLLINIMFNHLPGPHHYWTSQPLGFVSSAEGFFLISGFLVGTINARRQAEGRPLFQRLWQRIGTLYLYHLLALMAVFLVLGLGLGHLSSYYNITHFYLNEPTAAVLSSLMLLYQPPLLDILPLYMVFLAMTPWVWWLARRLHWLLVFALSASLWLLAQFNSMNEGLSFLRPWLLVRWGSFHLLAWQLLWIAGLGLGAWYWHHPGYRIPRWLLRLSLALASFFFLWRFALLPFAIDLGPLWMLVDKWRLGPLRLLNFMVLVVIAMALAPLFRHLFRHLEFLAILGKQSLLVFSLHAFLGLLLAGWVELIKPPQAERMLLLAIQISCIYWWAWRVRQYSRGTNYPMR